MDEFFAVSITLSSQNIEENGNDNIIDNTWWILDDAVSNQKENSDILETVASQKESNSSSFNGISDLGLNFLVNLTWFIDLFSIVN